MRTLAALLLIVAVPAFAGTQEAIDQSAQDFPRGATDLVPENHPKQDLSISLASSRRVAGASCGVAECDFLAFTAAPPVRRFTKDDAQALADAQRIARYGSCGMSVFKERRGAAWIFTTKVGYGGSPAPDILVVEPAREVPGFGRTTGKVDPSAPPPSTAVAAPAFPAGDPAQDRTQEPRQR